ncbi:MAG: substrate-binding domain-containing protein [Spirochaetota bacterium]
MHKRSFFRLVVAGFLLFALSLMPAVIMARDYDKPAKGMYFRLVTHGGDDPFWAVVQQGMIDAAKETGCRADIDLCGGDLSYQQKRFMEAVAMRPDGIALVINDDTAWDKPVADAIAKGINVIGMNNDDSQGSKGNARLCYIGQDERRAGLMIGRRLFKTGREQGWNLSRAHVAAAVEVPGANYGVVRSQGIEDAMKEFNMYGEIDIIDAGGLEMTTVESRITSYLIAHPETKFLFGLGGICTDRLTASLKNAGKKPGEIIAGGFDCAPGTLEGLKSGYVEATIDQQQYLQGYFAVYTLYLMKKYGFAPNIDTGGYLVDETNIELIEKYSPMKIR